MIQLTKLNGRKFFLNCELIKTIEQTPDSVITLTVGEKLMVLESTQDIISATMEYKKKLYQDPPEQVKGG